MESIKQSCVPDIADQPVCKTHRKVPLFKRMHETVEITHGFNDWFEVGFYFFNAIGSNNKRNC